MRHCSVVEQGYPRVGQACSTLANTGIGLDGIVVLGLALLVIGYVLYSITRDAG